MSVDVCRQKLMTNTLCIATGVCEERLWTNNKGGSVCMTITLYIERGMCTVELQLLSAGCVRQ